MKVLATDKLARIVKSLRVEKGMTQQDLGNKTNINRIMIGRIENDDYIPSISQLEQLSNCLSFDLGALFVEKNKNNSFVALKSQALNNTEREGVERLFTMMLTLRQQIQLRKSFKNETN